MMMTEMVFRTQKMLFQRIVQNNTTATMMVSGIMLTLMTIMMEFLMKMMRFH